MTVLHKARRAPDELALLRDLGARRRVASFKAMIARSKTTSRPSLLPSLRKASRPKARAAGKATADSPKMIQ
jgi:hypothetical protein